MAVIKGIAPSVSAGGDRTKPPAGLYKVLIKKVEDVDKEITEKDGTKKILTQAVFSFKIHPEHGAPVAGMTIPKYASTYFYPEKPDSETNGIFLALFMSGMKRDEATCRAAMNKGALDPTKHLVPGADGVEKEAFVKWLPDSRKWSKKNDDGSTSSGVGDVLNVLTPEQFQKALQEAKTNATAAAGGVADNDDPFGAPAGGAATPAVVNGVVAAAAAPASDDPFANM